jgi:hypothetical protein
MSQVGSIALIKMPAPTPDASLATGEIDVCVSALEEKRAITVGYAAIGVTRGVADVICLGLDDAAARRAFGQYPHEQFADEKTRELDGIDG